MLNIWLKRASGAVILVAVAFVVIPSLKNTITPKGIVIHHSAIPEITLVNASVINEIHRSQGFGSFYWGRRYNIAYHYVILPDGTVERGRPERLRGEHTFGHKDYIGICLVGDFSSLDNPAGELGHQYPTDAQMHSMEHLILDLQLRYKIPVEKVFLHRELNNATECPGDRFPAAQLRADLLKHKG